MNWNTHSSDINKKKDTKAVSGAASLQKVQICTFVYVLHLFSTHMHHLGFQKEAPVTAFVPFFWECKRN